MALSGFNAPFAAVGLAWEEYLRPFLLQKAPALLQRRSLAWSHSAVRSG